MEVQSGPPPLRLKPFKDFTSLYDRHPPHPRPVSLMWDPGWSVWGWEGGVWRMVGEGNMEVGEALMGLEGCFL